MSPQLPDSTDIDIDDDAIDLDPEGGGLLTRRETAVLLSRLLHSPVAVRTVASWPIAYRKLGHITLYQRSEVMAFAKARLANAPRAIGGVSNRSAVHASLTRAGRFG